jgi:glycosyltransferase involved in cell wall biosynthesis
MRIAYLDPHPVPDAIPEALQMLQTVDALARVGAAVTLVTPSPGGDPDPAAILGRPLARGARLVYLADLRQRWWAPSRSNKLFYVQARRWLRENRADAVLARNLRLAEEILDEPGLAPVFFETHEVFAQSFREEHPNMDRRRRVKLAALAKRERLVYARSRGLVALTQLLADDIRTEYALPTPIVVAPDGVDLEAARIADVPRAANPQPVLLYLGSLHPWKGVETAVAAMRDLPGAMLHVAGGAEVRIAELAALATHHGVRERVRFLGAVPPVQRFEVIAGADICLLPLTKTSIASRYTSPLKLFEYLAMGKPVIASDLDSVREVLTDGEDALLVPAADAAALAHGVRRVLEDAALAARIGRNAKARAAAFGWDARAKRMLDFMTAQLETAESRPA